MSKDAPDAGGPAFPFHFEVNGEPRWAQGLILRDYIAIHATDVDVMPYIREGLSREAARYKYADAMLAKRKEQP